jgi:hypothetical protein
MLTAGSDSHRHYHTRFALMIVVYTACWFDNATKISHSLN